MFVVKSVLVVESDAKCQSFRDCVTFVVGSVIY